MKIGVVGIPEGWSTERLADAVEGKTGFRSVIDLAEVSVDLKHNKAFFKSQTISDYDGLIIKKVGPAYSPDLLDRLDLLRCVESMGVRIFSAPARIHRVLNRLSCTTGLYTAGIPLPPTVVTEDVSEATEAVRKLGPCVLKPLYTSKARGMTIVEPGNALRDDLANFKASGNQVIYLQKVVELPGQDLGVVFLGGDYLTTYARVGKEGSWNTTTNSGGKYCQYDPNDEIKALAQKAQAIFGLDFTCVDVAETPDGPVVFEVSAFGGFRGLLEGCGMDAASMYADYVIKEISGE